MADYNLGALVGPVKRAAIDAWMVENNWEIRHGVYEISSRSSSSKVTRPGPDGNGGGDWSGDFGWLFGLDNNKDEQYQSAFAEIGESIDALVKPWLTLPDPADIEPYVEKCRLVTTRLSSTAWNDGKIQRPAGVELHGAIQSIRADADGIRGATGDSFRRNFLEGLSLVADGLTGMSVLRGGALAAQKGLWESARTDATAIVAKAQESFQAVADGGSGNLKRQFEVVGWALDGLKAFAPGLLDKVIDVALVGTDVATETAPEGVNEHAGSYAEGLTAFKNALEGLSQSIRSEEQEISRLVSSHIKTYRLSGYRENLDLTPDQITQHSEIALDPLKVESIANSFLPAIAVELNSIADLNAGCVSASVVARDSTIGLSPSGPTPSIIQLNTLLHDLIEDLAAESVEGAVQLKLAMNDFQESEAEMIATLNRIAADTIAGGSGSTGEDLNGDLSNISNDRVADPLYSETPTQVPTQPPYLPGYGPGGSSTLFDLMNGSEDELSDDH